VAPRCGRHLAARLKIGCTGQPSCLRGAARAIARSGRSIAGFHLRDALDLIAKRRPRTIIRFGVHAYAAGLTLACDALPRFGRGFRGRGARGAFEAQLQRTFRNRRRLQPGECSWRSSAPLRREVWGQGFPAPVFDDTFDVRRQRVVGPGISGSRSNAVANASTRIVFQQAEPLLPHPRAYRRT